MSRFIRQRPGAVAVHQAVARGETSAEAVMQDTLARIAELEPALRAWKFLDPDGALANARALDARLATGADIGPLGGVPLAVKDIFDTADMPTGYGSAVYEGHRPAADAASVRTVKRAGAVVVGKTVTTEFAYFTPGPTANPWNVDHTPGGSSSGSAAAVASGMVPLAFGSQTAGSLIRPASYCVVFALKPTHDSVTTEGVKPFAPSLDTLGWLANSAEDLELMRAVLAGEDHEPLHDAAGMRLMGCRTHEWAFTDAGGLAVWDRAHSLVGAAGIPLQTLDLPASLAGLMQAQKTVMAYEAARNLALEGEQHAERISPHIRDLIGVGRTVSNDEYAAAMTFAAQGLAQVLDLMQDADALLVPAAPGEAPAGLAATGDPIFSRVWTLLGMPCVNVPGLFGPGGLPVGLQLVGRPGQERRLLAVAQSLHRVLEAG